MSSDQAGQQAAAVCWTVIGMVGGLFLPGGVDAGVDGALQEGVQHLRGPRDSKALAKSIVKVGLSVGFAVLAAVAMGNPVSWIGLAGYLAVQAGVSVLAGMTTAGIFGDSYSGWQAAADAGAGALSGLTPGLLSVSGSIGARAGQALSTGGIALGTAVSAPAFSLAGGALSMAADEADKQ